MKINRLFRTRIAALRRREDGVALVAVIGICAVLLVMVASGLTLAASVSQKSSTDSSWNAAGAAAYAGISDYQSRLTNDNTYQKYGDPTAPFSVATSSSSLVLPTGVNANSAFDWRAGGDWSAIPNSSGNQAFRYEIDNSAYATQGTIRVLATGRSGNVTRSILANVRQKGFLDFLYFTDYETQDPALTGKSQADCTRYYPTRVDSDCGGAIQFAPGETIDGPVDSNDAMYICGGTFKGTVTSYYSTSPYYRDCGSATFLKGNPAPGPKLVMPPTNTAMRYETRGDLTGSDVPRPGCLYTGPTSIVFNGDGTMTVRSPWTKAVNISATGGMTNPACGTPGRGLNNGQTLGSDAGQTVPVPVQNVIFVQSVPSSTLPTEPNGWAATASPTGFSCPANGNNLGYPYAGPLTTSGSGSLRKTKQTVESITSTPTGAPYYGCKAGDVFIKGDLAGQVTVAADNYVWVTGDLTYKDPSSDVLGLVGQNAIWVWNPIIALQTCAVSTGTCTLGSNSNYLTDYGRTIKAAMLSVSHTFQVQNFDKGGLRGALTVVGAIAQKYRGTVGQTGTSGYSKNYSYDLRLRNIAPPKFLQAVSTTYGITAYADVRTAFKPDGTPVP